MKGGPIEKEERCAPQLVLDAATRRCDAQLRETRVPAAIIRVVGGARVSRVPVRKASSHPPPSLHREHLVLAVTDQEHLRHLPEGGQITL
eukprot:4407969-Pyramimonas_sp.AAC.1